MAWGSRWPGQTVPFDWDDRSRMRLLSFASSVYAMRNIAEVLGIEFPFPVPDEDNLVKPVAAKDGVTGRGPRPP